MKRIFIFLTLFLFTTSISYSQISDRKNNESTYLFGARPEAGNYAFYFGVTPADIEDIWLNTDWEESGIPLLNIKYYYTDQFVVKAGMQVSKKKRTMEGNLPGYQNDNESGGLLGYSSYKHAEIDESWGISMGAEQHFNLSNIIDVYMGVNGNLGYERSVRVDNISYHTGDYSNNEGSSFGLTYGLETIIGSNFFIADLPLAIGLETGFVAKNYGANKFKNEWSEKIGDVSNSGTYFSSLIDDFQDFNNSIDNLSNNNDFSELKARRFDIIPLTRVTFTYYFKR